MCFDKTRDLFPAKPEQWTTYEKERRPLCDTRSWPVTVVSGVTSRSEDDCPLVVEAKREKDQDVMCT